MAEGYYLKVNAGLLASSSETGAKINKFVISRISFSQKNQVFLYFFQFL